MAEKTECNYEQMQNISKQFQSEGDAIAQLMNATRGKVDGLHGTDWIGRGSEAFFAEMNELALPSLEKLVNALQQAATTTNQIITTYQQSEAEAQGRINTVNF